MTHVGVERPDPDGNGRRFAVSLPVWATSIGKAGVWALLAFWLLRVMIGMMTTDLVTLRERVDASAKSGSQMLAEMAMASATMNAFAARETERGQRIERLLYVMCVNNATTIVARDRCEATQR